jgi:hypothetical protein
VALGLYALHAREYRGWLIDDAGISIAYARHLSAGQGLTSQPGLAPVEGFSNPTWVAVLALLDRAGALVLPATPKIVGAVFVATTYALLAPLVDRIALRRGPVLAVTLVLCSLNPSLVAWSASGLENALYGATLVALVLATLVARERPGATMPVGCGALAALVAMTRPDGALFAMIPPLLLGQRGGGRALRRYVAAFSALFALFLLLRWTTFHRLLPNTAIAKGGPALFALFSVAGLAKAKTLVEAAVPSPLGDVVALAVVAGAWRLARRGHLGSALGVVLAFSAAAFADYMLLPADWMPETRFGTWFFPLYYTSALAILDRTLESPLVRRPRVAFVALAGALVLFCTPDFALRAAQFATSPPIDLFYVRRAFAERFDRYAAALEVRGGSVLLPDVGGMLLWSHLRVYDLAGLCDESIATLRTGDDDKAGLREVIFGEMRPTFIHAYSKYSRAVEFERDPRLTSDYESIYAYGDDEDPARGPSLSAILVRRDAIRSDRAREVLEALRAEPHARSTFMEPRTASPVLRWLARR